MTSLILIGFFYTWFVASVSIMFYKKFLEKPKGPDITFKSKREYIQKKHTYNLPQN